MNQRNESHFERIVKETSGFIGKACNVVKGSLGFEARSESSDLGLGSDCGSDTRRRSIDDDDDDVDVTITSEDKLNNDENKKYSAGMNNSDTEMSKKEKKSGTNLTRSRSCMNSIDCPENDGPEFDHIRYKIVKSRLFGKNIFGNIPNKGDVGYDGLMEYLREYSFQELLLDNNVVIIEPVRAEPVMKISSSSSKNTKKFQGLVKTQLTSQSKINKNNNDNQQVENLNDDKLNKTVSKQSTLKKHFFYHPIR